jgi:hypothetical protein
LTEPFAVFQFFKIGEAFFVFAFAVESNATQYERNVVTIEASLQGLF